MVELADWASLLEPYDSQLVFSVDDGQALLAELLGASNIESAVDHYISSTGTSREALRYALRLLQPAAATKRCLAVLWGDGGEKERMLAGDLLAVVSRSTDLDAIEALLLDDDPVRQIAAVRVLSQLQWSVDLDTEQMCRMTRHCVESSEPASRKLGLGLAVGTLDEILDREPGAGAERLSLDEVESMFARTLVSDEPSLVEAGLGRVPDLLVERLAPQLAGLSASKNSEIRALAQELLGDQKRRQSELGGD